MIIRYSDLNDTSINDLMRQLQSRELPADLSLALNTSKAITERSAESLMHFLISPDCPKNLKVILYDETNRKDSWIVPAPLIQALNSGKCQDGLCLDLTHENMNIVMAQQIAEILKSGRCPKGLRIQLGSIDDKQMISILTGALSSGNCDYATLIL